MAKVQKDINWAGVLYELIGLLRGCGARGTAPRGGGEGASRQGGEGTASGKDALRQGVGGRVGAAVGGPQSKTSRGEGGRGPRGRTPLGAGTPLGRGWGKGGLGEGRLEAGDGGVASGLDALRSGVGNRRGDLGAGRLEVGGGEGGGLGAGCLEAEDGEGGGLGVRRLEAEGEVVVASGQDASRPGMGGGRPWGRTPRGEGCRGPRGRTPLGAG
ncbi:hypothetical protein KY284_021030 [Solanum tuberosum]|nr:hypothetical protein KY284_021030 [Solanum tuberosum]